MTTPRINSHNSWSQLEEVWLGDVYPSSWYDHLEPAVRDVFQELTAITQDDLGKIQNTIESFGIQVQRPDYQRIDNFIDPRNGHLMKPEITPRDRFLVVGNELHTPPRGLEAWKYILEEYKKENGCQVVTNFQAQVINGANCVRVGKDLIIDCPWTNSYNIEGFVDYRVHKLTNGGHLDGCFAILRPGLILANHYFDDYEKNFPGWELIMLDNPTYHAAPSTGYQQPYPVYNGKFWDTTVGSNNLFNQHIVDHALEWVGCYTETYFELNCLVINESNVIMIGYNKELEKDLQDRGITVHWVPFRARSFWDGAMHCLTVDVRRQSTVEDFFPERECQP